MPVHPLTNVMPGLPKARLGNLVAGVESADAGTTKWAVTTYDFAVDGGAVGNINLLGSAGIPSGAVAIEAFVDVTTALTSGGAATAALSLEAAGDLLAAAVISGAPFSTTGRKNLLAQSGATSVKTTAARDIVLAVAVAALTAGKFTVYLNYIDPTAN
jgi:hypothetical protein